MTLDEFLLSTPGEVLDRITCYRIMQGISEKEETEYIPDLM